MSRSSPIELAFGQVTKADSLIVQLIKPYDNPEMILIIWPLKPPAVAPAEFQAGSPWWPIISCRPIDLGDPHGDWEVWSKNPFCFTGLPIPPRELASGRHLD